MGVVRSLEELSSSLLLSQPFLFFLRRRCMNISRLEERLSLSLSLSLSLLGTDGGLRGAGGLDARKDCVPGDLDMGRSSIEMNDRGSINAESECVSLERASSAGRSSIGSESERGDTDGVASVFVEAGELAVRLIRVGERSRGNGVRGRPCE